MPIIKVQGKDLDYLRIQPKGPLLSKKVIVMLHEGLGSISLWRDFPQIVADTTSHEVLVYSRYGYGNSESSPGFPFSYMHDEALKSLPELLEKLEIKNPILLGHSDGASITLIAAGGSAIDPQAVIVMAPHVMVEQICFDAIANASITYQNTDLKEKLGKHHADVDSAFLGWSGAWLSPEFKNWNIEEYLPNIKCPILAIQGYEDEYGTMAQLDKINEISSNAEFVETLKIKECRHSPHKDQTKIVLDQITHFIKKIK
jgi:pimeloyl-ACP methyl ester carboxylesterase